MPALAIARDFSLHNVRLSDVVTAAGRLDREAKWQLRACQLITFAFWRDRRAGSEPYWAAPVKNGRCLKIGFAIGSETPSMLTLTIPALEKSDPDILMTEEIEVGRHGIYIEKGFYRGVLLPQVATEHGWDRATFLEQTCRKAGLPADSWKDPATEIFVFSAEVFGETD